MFIKDLIVIAIIFFFNVLFFGTLFYLIYKGSKEASSSKITSDSIVRNIRAFSILDLFLGTVALLPLFIQVLSGQLIQPFYYLLAVFGLVFWIGGIGFLMRKSWGRSLHYLLGLLVGFSTLIGFLYFFFLWRFISNPKVKAYFK